MTFGPTAPSLQRMGGLIRNFGILLLLSTGGVAMAERAETGNMEALRTLFERGQEAYEHGRYDEALAAFMEAWEVRETPSLLYNAAVCREKLGDRTGAASLFRWYLDEAPQTRDRKAIEARIAALRKPAR